MMGRCGCKGKGCGCDKTFWGLECYASLHSCLQINYMLLAGCIAMVAGFQDTTALGHAYGVAVITVMFITTVLSGLVMLVCLDINPALVVLFVLFFGESQLVCIHIKLQTLFCSWLRLVNWQDVCGHCCNTALPTAVLHWCTGSAVLHEVQHRATWQA